METEVEIEGFSPSTVESLKGTNFPIEQYDKFAWIKSSEKKDFLLVPVYIYELFKGIALEHINLSTNKSLLDLDLTAMYEKESRAFLFKQYP